VDVIARYCLFNRNTGRKLGLSGFWGNPFRRKAPLPIEVRDRVSRFALQATALMVLNTVVWEKSELLFLQVFGTPAQLAFYTLAIGVADRLVFLVRVIPSAVAPAMFARYGDDPDAQARVTHTTLRYVSLLACPSFVCVTLLSGPLIRVLYGREYYSAVPVLTVAAAFGVSKGLMQPLVHLFAGAERQKFQLAALSALAVVVLALDWGLVSRYHEVGAAWANGIGQSLALLTFWYYARRSINMLSPPAEILLPAVLSTGIGVVVWWGVRSIPDLLALLVAPPLFAAAYIAGLRIVGVLQPQDEERLRALDAMLPPGLRSAYAALWRFLVPTGARR
jgi:O-antigen/teichoic acid export membrane protein